MRAIHTYRHMRWLWSYIIYIVYIAWFLDSEINFDQLWSCWNKCGHVTHIAAHITHWTDGDATNILIAWHLTRDGTHDRTAGFQKNEYWASCKTSCTAGIDPADPPEYATPWTCKALACTTSMTCKLFDCCNILYSSTPKCLFAIIHQCSFDFWEFTHSRISVRSVKFVAFYGIFFGSYSLVTFVCIANYA